MKGDLLAQGPFKRGQTSRLTKERFIRGACQLWDLLERTNKLREGWSIERGVHKREAIQ